MKSRIKSIDILRGIVMLLMAIDHVRDFFHITANTDNPLNLATTTPQLFFTRWITHFCAPVFLFLSGVSIYLQSKRKSKQELSRFLITRGLWLVLAELTIVTFAWSFNPFFNVFVFGVIAVIGMSMIVLGIMIYLPYKLILLSALLIVAGHNLLDIYESGEDFKPGFWIDFLHHANFSPYPVSNDQVILLIYALIPWLGLMLLGFSLGKWFTPDVSQAVRKRNLIFTGTGMILLFVILRSINAYGDPVEWTPQRTPLYTVLSFMNVNKYPPSLLYACITIGPALIILALIEKIKNSLTRILNIFGRTAFFYYLLHIYLIHLFAAVLFFINGHSFSEGIYPSGTFPFFFVAAGEGLGLTGTYLVTLLVITLLYPLCKWYDKYKTLHREKKWLSYL